MQARVRLSNFLQGVTQTWPESDSTPKELNSHQPLASHEQRFERDMKEWIGICREHRRTRHGTSEV